jgi:hypothetical protein
VQARALLLLLLTQTPGIRREGQEPGGREQGCSPVRFPCVPLLLLLLVVPLFFLSFLWVPLLVCALCCPLLVDEQASGLPTVSPQAAAAWKGAGSQRES